MGFLIRLKLLTFVRMENPGWIYIIADPELHLVKVGRTKDVIKRLMYYKISSLYPIAFIGAFKINNYDKVEKQIHREFKKDKFKGEWFVLDTEVVINHIFDNYKDDMIEWFKEDFENMAFRMLQTRIDCEKIRKLRDGINPIVNSSIELKCGDNIINTAELINEFKDKFNNILTNHEQHR